MSQRLIFILHKKMNKLLVIMCLMACHTN